MDVLIRVLVMLAVATVSHYFMAWIRKKLKIQKTWTRRNEIFYFVIVTILLLGVVAVVGLSVEAVLLIGLAYGVPGLFGRPLFTVTK